MARVFISQAQKDKEIVDAFFDLLHTGLDLSPRDVFCSSLEGMGIPSGTNFVEYIRSKIANPELVILVLSCNYFDSTFCQCELGASWALSTAVLPILIPPLTYDDMRAVLTGVQARKIDSDTDLSEVRDELVSRLGLASSIARWDAKKKQFLKNVPELLKRQALPERVDLAKYKQLENKYEDAVNQLEAAFAHNDDLKLQIDDLKKCKDAQEVAEVVAAHSDDWSLFSALCDRAREALGRLPSVVQEVAFHELGGHEFIPPTEGSWEGRDTWDRIRDAIKDDMLKIDSRDDIQLNSDDPTVAKATEALHKVQMFLDGNVDGHEVGQAFDEQYTERYDHRPSFASRKLWKACFDL